MHSSSGWNYGPNGGGLPPGDPPTLSCDTLWPAKPMVGVRAVGPSSIEIKEENNPGSAENPMAFEFYLLNGPQESDVTVNFTVLGGGATPPRTQATKGVDFTKRE
jgi:hypothetical protein